VDWVSDEIERICLLIAEREDAGDFGPDHDALCAEFDRMMTGVSEKEFQAAQLAAENDPEAAEAGVAVTSSILSGELASKLQRRRTMNNSGAGATTKLDHAGEKHVDRTTGELAGKLQRRNKFNTAGDAGTLPTAALADASADVKSKDFADRPTSELAQKLDKRATVIDEAEEAEAAAAAAAAAAAVTATPIDEDEAIKIENATVVHAQAIADAPPPPPLNQKTPGCFCLLGCGSRKEAGRAFG